MVLRKSTESESEGMQLECYQLNQTVYKYKIEMNIHIFVYEREKRKTKSHDLSFSSAGMFYRLCYFISQRAM